MKTKAPLKTSHANTTTTKKRSATLFFEKTSSSKVQPFFNPNIQPKLKVGKAGDKFEQQADNMADEVVSGKSVESSPIFNRVTPVTQRKEDDQLQSKTLQSSSKNDEELQRREDQQENEEVQTKLNLQKTETKDDDNSTVQKMVQAKNEEEIQKQSEEEEEAAQTKKEEGAELNLQKMEEEEAAQTKNENGKENSEEDSDSTIQKQEKEEDGLQKKENEGEEEVQTQGEDNESLQAKRSENTSKNIDPSSQLELKSQKGKGSPLNDTVRKKMEQSFHADFSGVKIHTDDAAVVLTKQLNAQALTHGKDIYFNKNKFNPNTRKGEHLLVHELTHTIQQGAAGPNPLQLRSDPSLIQTKEEEGETYQIRPELLKALRLARGEIGKVNSKQTGPDKTRLGWERLYEFFKTAFGGEKPLSKSVHKDVIKFFKTYKVEGKAKDALPSWCGIFVWWSLKEAGVPLPDWKLGVGVHQNFKSRLPNELPKKGDIAQKTTNQHFAIVSGVENPKGKSIKSVQVATINGNTAGEDLLGGQIQEKWEPIGNWVVFYDPVSKLNLPDVPLVETGLGPDPEIPEPEPEKEIKKSEKPEPKEKSFGEKSLEEPVAEAIDEVPSAEESAIEVELPEPPASTEIEKGAEVEALDFKGSSDESVVEFSDSSPSSMAKSFPALGGAVTEKLGSEKKDEVDNAPVLVAKTSGKLDEGIVSPEDIPIPNANINEGLTENNTPDLQADSHENFAKAPSNQEKEKLLDKKEKEPGFIEWLKNNIRNFMAGVKTSDNGLNTSAGERPKVNLDGEANPNRANVQRKEADGQLKSQRDTLTEKFKNHPGQKNIQPKEINEEKPVELNGENNEIVETTEDTNMADYAEAPLPADVRGKADEILETTIKPHSQEVKTEAQTAAEEKENNKRVEIEKAESEAAKINEKADKDQRDVVLDNRKKVANEQKQGIEQAYNHVNEFNKGAQEKQKTTNQDITGKVNTSQSEAKGKLEKAEKDVKERKEADEKIAAEKKRQLEKEQENQSWWDRAKSFVKKAVKALTSAIDGIFNALRKFVKETIEKAKNAAIGLINKARDWVVDKLNKFRDWAKDQVNKYLGDTFPGLAKAINGAIDGFVDGAIAGVNAAADAAIAGIEALAKGLTAALDKILSVFQTALKAAVAIAGAVITGDFLEALKIAIQAGCDIAGINSKPIFDFFEKAGNQLIKILKEPGVFFNNLMSAVGGGVRNFAKNIKKHLIKGLIGWLTGALSEVAITLPDKFDFRGILSLVLQILGLTYENIKARVIKRFPKAEKVFSAIEKGIEIINRIRTEGIGAIWTMVKESLSNLKEMVLSGIRNFVITTVVKEAITWILGLLNPAGALVKILKLLFDFVMFLIERFQQIKDFILSVYNSITAIASGQLTKAMTAVEDAMSRSLPVVISLLASLAGLGGIGKTIKDIIKKVTKPINKVIDKIIDKVVKFAKKLLKKGKAGAKKLKEKLLNWWKAKKSFKGNDGKSHKVYYKGKEANADLYVASKPYTIPVFLKNKEKEINKLPDDDKNKKKQSSALEKAKTIQKEIEQLETNLQKFQSKKHKPIDPAAKKEFDKLKKKLAALTTQLQILFQEEDPKFPPAVLPPFSMGVRASGFQAEYISKKTGTGSPAGGQNIPGWDTIDKYGLGKGSKWVRMHMLPDRLGGKATSSNLVPARGPETNIEFANQVELEAWKYKEGKLSQFKPKKPSQGNLIWYKVNLRFGHTQKEFVNFPSRIAAEFGTYEWTSNKWQPKAAPAGIKNNGKWSQNPKPPDISGGPETKEYYLDTDGRDRLKQIPEALGYGETIWKERSERGLFKRKDSFKKRMRERNEDLPTQNQIKNLKQRLDAIAANPNVKMKKK